MRPVRGVRCWWYAYLAGYPLNFKIRISRMIAKQARHRGHPVPTLDDVIEVGAHMYRVLDRLARALGTSYSPK